MEIGNAINLIATIVTLIGIVVGIIQLSRSNSRDGVGSFVSFRLEAHRRCSIVMTRMIQICGLLVLAIYVSESVIRYSGLMADWPHGRELGAFESVLIWVAIISSFVLNQVVSFIDFKRIDRWINNNELAKVVVASLQICIFICAALYLIASVFNLALFGETGTLIAVFTFGLCLFVTFASFLRTYFRLRSLYEVSDTKVVLRGLDYEYVDIHNFRYSKGNLIFIYNDKGILKKIQTNEKNVLYIEQVIDLETNLKAIKLSADAGKMNYA